MNSLLAASLALTVAGLIAWILLVPISLRSRRLRSLIVVLVLLQGLMIVRTPVNLPWLAPTPVVARHIENGFGDPSPRLNTQDAKDPSPAAIAAQSGSQTSTSLVAATWFSRAWNWSSLLSIVWLIGVIALLARSTFRYVRLLRYLQQLKPAPDRWRNEVDRILNNELSGQFELLVSETAGPMLVRRPSSYALVVPREYWGNLRSAQRHGVILHELAHLERRDVWRQTLSGLVTAIHWFNPVAWWARRQYELLCEYACDQRVAESGPNVAASFASAIVELVQWKDSLPGLGRRDHMPGCQSMSAPPVKLRIARLLQPKQEGDSVMKRIVVCSLAMVLVVVSFVQFRLTHAQTKSAKPVGTVLEVLDPATAKTLDDLETRLDQDDNVTATFSSLLESPSGRVVLTGVLNELAQQGRREARDSAIPSFIEKHFQEEPDGTLVLRDASKQIAERWLQESEQMQSRIDAVRKVTDDIASRLDDSSEAAGLFKRLLIDSEAPVAVLIGEMEGGDVIRRYLQDRLERILVDEGDGTFRIVDSQRREAEQQIERFERASKISERLERQLPRLANEYASEDDDHRALVSYLKNPVTASIAAMKIAEDSDVTVTEATDRLHKHFEDASIDTSNGLQIRDKEAWSQLREIFAQVDRAETALESMRVKLQDVADTLSTEDALTNRLADQMRQDALAVMLAAELPYAEANPGEELRATFSEVLVERNEKLAVRSEVEDKLTEKARELLQTCRQIRRYVADIDEHLQKLRDQSLVQRLGPAGRYMLLDQIRRQSENFRPDSLAMLEDRLFEATPAAKLRVRGDRREEIQRLLEQVNAINNEAARDDF